MRGRDNSNYLSTRKLCNNLYKILGLTKNITFNFLKTINIGLVHKISEEAMDSDEKLNIISIEIPFIGNMKVDIKNNTATVDLEDEFRKQIIDAVTEGKSPLIESAEKALIESVNKRYDSLI